MIVKAGITIVGVKSSVSVAANASSSGLEKVGVLVF